MFLEKFLVKPFSSSTSSGLKISTVLKYLTAQAASGFFHYEENEAVKAQRKTAVDTLAAFIVANSETVLECFKLSQIGSVEKFAAYAANNILVYSLGTNQVRATSQLLELSNILTLTDGKNIPADFPILLTAAKNKRAYYPTTNGVDTFVVATVKDWEPLQGKSPFLGTQRDQKDIFCALIKAAYLSQKTNSKGASFGISYDATTAAIDRAQIDKVEEKAAKLAFLERYKVEYNDGANYGYNFAALSKKVTNLKNWMGKIETLEKDYFAGYTNNFVPFFELFAELVELESETTHETTVEDLNDKIEQALAGYFLDVTAKLDGSDIKVLAQKNEAYILELCQKYGFLNVLELNELQGELFAVMSQDIETVRKFYVKPYGVDGTVIFPRGFKAANAQNNHTNDDLKSWKEGYYNDFLNSVHRSLVAVWLELSKQKNKQAAAKLETVTAQIKTVERFKANFLAWFYTDHKRAKNVLNRAKKLQELQQDFLTGNFSTPPALLVELSEKCEFAQKIKNFFDKPCSYCSIAKSVTNAATAKKAKQLRFLMWQICNKLTPANIEQTAAAAAAKSSLNAYTITESDGQKEIIFNIELPQAQQYIATINGKQILTPAVVLIPYLALMVTDIFAADSFELNPSLTEYFQDKGKFIATDLLFSTLEQFGGEGIVSRKTYETNRNNSDRQTDGNGLGTATVPSTNNARQTGLDCLRLSLTAAQTAQKD